MGMYTWPGRITRDMKVKVITGRNEWCLRELMKAGKRGCTSLSHPAPRWSAYVFCLRELGIDIETVREEHKGEFPGHHARYILRSNVRSVAGGTKRC